MSHSQIFYQAIKDKEYRIFETQDDKYITKIADSEYTDRKKWNCLGDALNYIEVKKKENENKGWRE